MADDVAQQLQPMVLTDILDDSSDNDNIPDDFCGENMCKQIENSHQQDHRLLNSFTSFQNLSHLDRLTRNSQKTRLCYTEADKVIRRPVMSLSLDDRCHINESTTTVLYDNPFDDRLFEGLYKALKFCLVGSPVTSCDTNVFIGRENTIKLIENNLLGYRLFVMIPALTSNGPLHQHPDNFFSDAILHSWQLFIGVMGIPQQVVDRWASFELKLKNIWSADDVSPLSSYRRSECKLQSKLSQSKQVVRGPTGARQATNFSSHKLEEKTETLSAATSLTDELSDVSPHCYKKDSAIYKDTKQTSSKTSSLDSLPHSPCRKLKRVDSEREMMDESGYLSSQQTHGSADEDRVFTNNSEEESSSKLTKVPSMNPLAEPFVYKNTPSCEERIMVDQLAVNRSFGIDEPIENQFCCNFFPAMPAPQFFQAGNVPSNHINISQRIPQQTKPTFDSANVLQNCQIPMNMQANNSTQLSLNVSNQRHSQNIFVSAPIAAPAPPTNQQPPMFINASVPPRCTWVPAQSLVLGPVNQPGILPTPNMIAHSLPQVQSQVLLPNTNQIPLYLMQSQSNKPPALSSTNQQYNSMCRSMVPATFVPALTNHQNQDSAISNQASCGNPQVQKELIKSALELMKCRPSLSGRMQFTASRQ